MLVKDILLLALVLKVPINSIVTLKTLFEADYHLSGIKHMYFTN